MLTIAASPWSCATSNGVPGPSAPTSALEPSPALMAVSVPGGARGIGFDDIRYVPALDRVVVPAGHTGALAILHGTNVEVESVTGFATQDAFRGGHDVGTTSADGADGVIVATDRTARVLDVVDPTRHAIIGTARLGAKPDLVRFVEARREAWVTEPDAERIEVFSVPVGTQPIATAKGSIATPGGPEGLAIDRPRSRAYTHLGPTTVAIDLESHAIVARWTTGCAAPSGIALDEVGALLFVGCADGQVAVVDLAKGGQVVARLPVTSSIDHLAFSAQSRHLFVPDTRNARLTTLAVSREGRLSVLGVLATVAGTECVTTDDKGHVYLCDPEHGRILVVTDLHAPSGADP